MVTCDCAKYDIQHLGVREMEVLAQDTGDG